MKKKDMIELFTEEIVNSYNKFDISDAKLAIFMEIIKGINFIKEFDNTPSVFAMIIRILREADITVEEGIQYIKEYCEQYPKVVLHTDVIESHYNIDTEALFCKAFAENKINVIKQKI